MRQLHVVALSEDGRSVLLATSKSAKTGAFSVALDGRLSAAVRGDLPRTGEQQARQSEVTPKEIQARLRAGESPEEIAADAGVPVARVERFAGPVLSERERIIQEARSGYVTRSRRGLSELPLGDAVDAALAETSGLRPDSVAWSARRLESGHWLVQVAYVARARARTASYIFEPHSRSVTASDPESAAFGHVGEEPGARRASASARQAPMAAVGPSAQAPIKPRKKAAKKVVRKAAQKAAAPVEGDADVYTTGPAVDKKARKRTAKPPAPVVQWGAPVEPVSTAEPSRPPTLRVVPQPAPEPAAAPEPAVTAAPAAPTPSERQPAAAPPRPETSDSPEEISEPAHSAAEGAASVAETSPAEPGAADEAAAPREAAPMPERKRRAAGERAQVPDWADVLFGAAPKRPKD